MTFGNNGYVKASKSGATATFNGGIVISNNAAASLTIGSGAHTIACTVTLNSGSTFTIPTSATTVSGATFASGDPLYKVNTAVGESTTVYSLEKKPGTIFSVY